MKIDITKEELEILIEALDNSLTSYEFETKQKLKLYLKVIALSAGIGKVQDELV